MPVLLYSVCGWMSATFFFIVSLGMWWWSNGWLQFANAAFYCKIWYAQYRPNFTSSEETEPF